MTPSPTQADVRCMEHLLLLLICFLLGIILGRVGRLPATAPSGLNAFIINISLPALAVLHIHDLRLDSSLLLPPLAPWILFIVGALLFRTVGKWMNMPQKTIGCLMLLGGLGNTSFVGLPMIEAFYGEQYGDEAVAIGMLVDQPGSFLVLTTLGLIVAARYSGGAIGARAMILRVFRFVPFWGMIAGFLLIPVDYPETVRFLLQRLGDTLTPLALVSVGMQLKPSQLRGNGSRVALGLSWKMILGPALVLLLYSLVPHVEQPVLDITVFESAMPPMITAGIVAIEHDLDPPLAMLMLGIGIPLSFLTLAIWWYLL